MGSKHIVSGGKAGLLAHVHTATAALLIGASVVGGGLYVTHAAQNFDKNDAVVSSNRVAKNVHTSNSNAAKMLDYASHGLENLNNSTNISKVKNTLAEDSVQSNFGPNNGAVQYNNAAQSDAVVNKSTVALNEKSSPVINSNQTTSGNTTNNTGKKTANQTNGSKSVEQNTKDNSNSVSETGVTQVSTFDQLLDAFQSKTPMKIHLTKDITMTRSIDVANVNNPDLTIDGSDGDGGRYTIDFGNYHVRSTGNGNHLTLENLSTKGGSTAWSYGVFTYDDGGTITARNVDHSGVEFLLASDGITLGGDVDIDITKDAANLNAISVWGTNRSGEGPLVIEDESEVNINQDGRIPYQGMINMERGTSFVVGNYATLNVNLNAPSGNIVGAPVNNKLAVDIKNGARVNMKANHSGINVFEGYMASLDIEKGGELYASAVDRPVFNLLGGGSTTINISGYFDLSATNGKTSPFSSTGHETTVNFNNVPISLWSNGNTSESPSYAYQTVNGSAVVYGTATRSVNTDNSDFNKNFVFNKIYRLACKGPDHNAPTFDGVDDKTINAGDDFDPMEGVSAKDWKGNDLQNHIEVLGNVYTGTPGKYTLTYKVIDNEGLETTVKRTITVKAKEETVSGHILKVEDFKVGDNLIKGTTDGDIKLVALEINGKLLAKNIDKNGAFTYYVRMDEALQPSDKAYIVGFDAKLNELDRKPVNIIE